MKTRIPTVSLGLVAAFGLAACAPRATPDSAKSAAKADQAIAGQQLQEYQRNQPARQYDWSQLRQNLIEIEEAQVKATATTSFFFNLGVGDPVHVCPSIGFPIPATYQLSNPQQVINGGSSKGGYWGATIPQIENNGVFTGDTTGTYVICVNPDGSAYADYWEGSVKTVTGPARWDQAIHRIEMTGGPSATFSTKQ